MAALSMLAVDRLIPRFLQDTAFASSPARSPLLDALTKRAFRLFGSLSTGEEFPQSEVDKYVKAVSCTGPWGSGPCWQYQGGHCAGYSCSGSCYPEYGYCPTGSNCWYDFSTGCTCCDCFCFGYAWCYCSDCT
jgi:hypothetical protein